MLDHALRYQSAGFSVIPIRPDFDPVEQKFLKKPYIKWLEYQKRKSTEDEIRSWWKQWPKAMIGIITGELSNLYAIDCDTEEAYQKIQELLPDSFLTATVKTPRGGHHLWVRCANGNQLTTNSAIFPNIDTRGNGGYIIAPPSQNENGGTYQWLEGLSFLEAVPQELPINILSILKGGIIRGGDNIEIKENLTEPYIHNIILQKGRRDADLFRIGMALADGRCSRNDLIQVLEILAKNCNPPFPERELKDKIKSIWESVARKERNLMDEVREWCSLQKGYFSLSDTLRDLHILTKPEKNNLYVVINRLQDKGIIEKHGEKRGEYRTKEKIGDFDMTFIESTIPEFDIILPFGLNGIVSIYPKNIIIIAGSKSSGKTSIMMKVALANQDRIPVVYFNSEMGDEEWSVRLKKMGVFKKADQRFRAMGVHKNFHDMMNGEKKIYIVDYLEIHDNFFEIAKPIRRIHETIKDGICIIGVQKKRGELLARGGDFSAEKSRLYLSLDFLEEQKCTQLTIVDAKSPKISENPRGWTKRIKIIDGSRIESIDKDWRF